MSTRNDITDKIRRLLALGQSNHTHEAEAALAKAAELASRHSIDIGSIKADEERSRVAEQTFASRCIFDCVENAAINLCMMMFRVRCLYNLRTATFIGMEHNVTAAVFARSFVIEQCGRDLKAFKSKRWRDERRRVPYGAQEQFAKAWCWAVVHKHRQAIKEDKDTMQTPEIDDSKTAIILRDQEKEIDDHIAANYPDTPKEGKKKSRVKKDNGAINAGIVAGIKVTIARPIEGKASDGQ